MKREIELKFRIGALAPIRNHLKRLGARLIWKGREKNWYLDTKTESLKKRGMALRMRSAGTTLITLKTRLTKTKFKSADEYQLGIEDPKEMLAILKHLGYTPWLEYVKYREYWRLSNAEITLDVLPFGKFVEIEGSERMIQNLAKKLGLNVAKTTTKSYSQLLEEYRKKKMPR